MENKLRTEEEVLKDFEKLDFRITENTSRWIVLLDIEKYERLFIYRKKRIYNSHFPITMDVQKLLNELFSIWGWL